MSFSHENPDLVFVHLSDIHFRKGHSGDLHDKDQAVRHELEIGLRQVRAQMPRLDGILITGDIAYSGKKEEFEYAKGWIERIRELLGCDKAGVMVTPGNHDIDRDLVPLRGEVDALHQSIRKGSDIDAYDQALAEVMRDAVKGNALMKPLAAYNDFAEEYGCRITRDTPYWERAFPLTDGSSFLIRGLTTVLISGIKDDEQKSKMLYGGAQRTILRLPNTRRALIGHHPPSWSLEGDEADRLFSTLTSLHAFGHKHAQWITPIGNSVRIIAGALQPDRNEKGWMPRFSAIGIFALDPRRLGLVVYPQKWTEEEHMFIADINSRREDFREYVVTT
jgi:hypothetical protein